MISRYAANLILLATALFPLLHASAEPEASGVSFDANLRLRSELVDHFHPPEQNPNSEYLYHHAKLQFGALLRQGGFRAYAQGQYFQLLDLPFNGVGPGAVYSSTNDGERNPGDLILRQLYLAYTKPQRAELAVGRMLYANGSEAPHADKRVETLKKQRIYNRVLGTFDFTAGRSFDSLRAHYDLEHLGRFTTGLMRPTQGGFSTEGSIEIQEIDLATAAWSVAPTVLPSTTDAQLFWYYYGDDRADTVKTDNRDLAIRKTDLADIQLQNFGVHWVELFPGEQFTGQLLLWGMLQVGDWGAQEVRAGAFAVEGGTQLNELWSRPLFRLGYNYGSGDDDPSDSKHHTFMQMLPTARQYAFTPFYNMMNNEDLFASATLAPAEGLSLTTTVHYLALAERADLLYSGGGANLKDRQFGFAGLPLAGSTLGVLPELSISYDISATTALALYYGHLFSSDSFEESARGSNLNYAFAELNVKY